MMTESYGEAAIIVFIILTLLYLIRRQGQRNPVPTGNLDKRLSGIETKVDEIETRVENMEGKYAKVSDIKRLERRLETYDEKIDEVRKELAGVREDIAAGQAQRASTARQLDMIYQVIVQKGMKS